MAHPQIIEGTPAQIAGLLGRLSIGKRYRVIEIEDTEANAEPTEMKSVLDEKTKAAIAFLDARIAEGLSADPEEIREAEEELAEFKRNMNANREATGKGLFFRDPYL